MIELYRGNSIIGRSIRSYSFIMKKLYPNWKCYKLQAFSQFLTILDFCLSLPSFPHPFSVSSSTTLLTHLTAFAISLTFSSDLPGQRTDENSLPCLDKWGSTICLLSLPRYPTDYKYRYPSFCFPVSPALPFLFCYHALMKFSRPYISPLTHLFSPFPIARSVPQPTALPQFLLPLFLPSPVWSMPSTLNSFPSPSFLIF